MNLCNRICQVLRQLPNRSPRRFYCVSDKSGTGKNILKDGPPLEYFIANSTTSPVPEQNCTSQEPSVAYIDRNLLKGNNRKVYFETYGCQMNVNDTEIAWSILQKHGFEKTNIIKESDVVLIMTCAIREGAEQKIWKRLIGLTQMKKHIQQKHKRDMKIGILGCMAERLKSQILEKEKMVDLVCGPDAYRDLPHMLAVTESGENAVNVVLSLEETYADVVPVRLNSNSPSAFVSIMRGCDNMCSYCIVPFTRGRERSRPMQSILEEVRALSDMGIKEITLLGQNVNSYRDLSEINSTGFANQETDTSDLKSRPTVLATGFKTIYKPKVGGKRFSDLLDKVSQIDPEMRIRFTSPHPKDFPDEVLYLIKERPNICHHIHMPAQSGSTKVLEAMRRGYTREAYIDLVHHIREILPGVSLNSDFIAGFCGETEQDHADSVSLLRLVKYNWAFCFPYSMRQKTRAYHRLEDDVPPEEKSRRHMELCSVFREETFKLNQAQIGERQLVLIEGTSKRSEEDMAGRNDGNTKVIVPQTELIEYENHTCRRPIKPGDYVVVDITDASSQVLKGKPVYHSTLQDFHSRKEQCIAFG